MTDALVEKIAVAAIAGLFGFLPALLQWLSNLAKRREKTSQLADLRAELEFLERWQALHKNVGADFDNSTDRLDEPLRQGLRNLLRDYQAIARPAVTELRVAPKLSFTRRFLLLYMPRNVAGWIWHTLFYSVVFMLLALLTFGFIQDGLTGEFLFGLLGAFVIFTPPLLITYGLARRSSPSPQ